MKTYICTLGMMAVCSAGCFAQAPAATPAPDDAVTVPQPMVKKAQQGAITREAVLQAIAQFRQDPLRANEAGAGVLILTFAEESPDVNVGVGSKVLPWMEGDHAGQKYETLLTLAFMAGDVQSQLEGHVKKDDPMAGVLQVIDTYQLLKKSGVALQVPVVEHWIALQRQGKLRGFLEGK